MPTDYSARMLVASGSLLLQSGAVPEALRADAALIADVSQELSSVRLGTPALAVALARGETTATLLAQAHALYPELGEFRDAVRVLGVIDLNDGLGMLSSLGRAAALVALHGERVRARIDKDLVIPLLRLHNGTLRHVSIWALNSLAGGVGSQAGALFALAVAAGLRGRSDAIVDILSLQVGALSFLGLGDRILDNAAAGLLEHLAMLSDPDRDRRQSCQLVLSELPTIDCARNEIGYNRALRSSLAISLASAFAAPDVQASIQAGRTNRAMGLHVSGVSLIRANWFGSLPAEEIVAAAARNYLGELDTPDALETAVPSTIEFIETQLTPHRKSPAELAALALRSRLKPELFDSDALSEARFAALLRFEGMSPDEASKAAIDSSLTGGHAPAVARLKTISTAIQTSLAKERASEASETSRANAFKRRVREATALLFPQGDALLTARRLFMGPRGAAASFTAALTSWREVQTRLARAAARRSALEAAATTVGAALARIGATLQRLRTALEAIAGTVARCIFRFSPLNEVSALFMRAIGSGDIPLLRSHLARSAREMSPDGLAAMLRADGAQPAEIVASLAAPPLFSAPFWGGSEPSAPPFFTAIVLPPLSPAFHGALCSAARDAGFRNDFLRGDTLAGGAAVVGIEAYEAHSMAELFPAPYLSGLREIVGPKCSLYPLSPGAKALAKTLLNGVAVCA
jgi:hypothetical protein